MAYKISNKKSQLEKEFLKLDKELEKIKDEGQPLTLEDFKEAFILFNTGFRGGHLLCPRLKKLRADSLLAYSLYTLRSRYMAFLTFFAGLLIVGFATLMFIGTEVALYSLVFWTLVFFLGLGPLIYAYLLPRPIASHLVEAGDLEESDLEFLRKLREEEDRTRAILKKYKNSGYN